MFYLSTALAFKHRKTRLYKWRANLSCFFTVSAVSPKSAFNNPKAIIEAADFSVLQKEANTLTDLRYRLANIINGLLRDVIPAQAGILFTVSASDIVIFAYNFRPAQTGTLDNSQGMNGYFEFRVTPPSTRTSAYNDGTITATSYDDVANEQLTMNNYIYYIYYNG